MLKVKNKLNILLIYRYNLSATKDEFLKQYNKFKNENITFVAEDDFHRNKMNLYFKMNKIITIKELLEGDLDNMQFDYIVGNPPYQYPNGVEKSKKLYIDITHKVLPLLNDKGILSFITPNAIMVDGSKNKVFKKLNGKISDIDYTITNNFQIGQKVCHWLYNNSHQGDINLKYNNSILKIKTLHDACDESNQLLLSICNKLDYKRNNKKKAPLNRSFNENYIDDYQLNKNENSIEIYTNSSKNRIQYCDSSLRNNSRERLLIPYIGGWKQGCYISNIQVNSNSIIDSTSENLSNNQRLIMKNLLESKLYSYCVVNYTSLTGIKPQGFYSFLLKISIPEDELSKSWTDEELYEEFQLTTEEINEVEEWYKEWKK